MFCGEIIHLDATSCFSKLVSRSMAISESFFGSSRVWGSGNKCQDLRVRPFLLRLSYSLFRLLPTMTQENPGGRDLRDTCEESTEPIGPTHDEAGQRT